MFIWIMKSKFCDSLHSCCTRFIDPELLNYNPQTNLGLVEQRKLTKFVFYSNWTRWKTEQNCWNQRWWSVAVMLPNSDPFKVFIIYYCQRDSTLGVFKEIFVLQKWDFKNDLDLHFQDHLLQEWDGQLQCEYFGENMMKIGCNHL